MRDALSALRKTLVKLAVPSTPTRCFECVTGTQALQASEVLQLAANKTGCFHAGVFRRRKKSGFLSPPSFPFLPRRFRCFTFQELFLVFAAAVSVTYVPVGSHVVQLSTLSIGGTMSMIASAVVLCLCEQKWLKNPAARRAKGFVAEVSWKHQVAALRYVDDLLQISAMYCANCLDEVPGAVHDVPFNLAESGTSVTWIDLHISVNPVLIGMAQKDPLLQPPWAAKPGYARGWLCGRFARWQQVGLSHTQTADEVSRVFWVFVQNGFSARFLRGLVYSFKHERRAAEFQVLRACYCQAVPPLNTARRSLSLEAVLWCHVPPHSWMGLCLGWLMAPASATSRQGKNGERY